MVFVPAAPRSLTAFASTTAIAGPVSDTVSASDELFERASTLSRSLGAGRGSTTTQDAAPPLANVAPAAPVPEPAPVPAPAPAPTPSVDDARTFALEQIGAAQFSCLDTLWQHESDWDPSAENPTSGAFGIAQALPAAKMASAGDDWMTNPITQVKWGLDYIARRYGSACNAWSFWLRHYPHWY